MDWQGLIRADYTEVLGWVRRNHRPRIVGSGPVGVRRLLNALVDAEFLRRNGHDASCGTGNVHL